MLINKDFREFIQCLNHHNARYLTVGGYVVAKRLVVEIEGLPVNFIDLDNLRQNNKTSGRFQELADLENLE